MSSSRRNLWPQDIAVTDLVPPVAILKEQASLLGKQTQNLVEAHVVLGGSRNPGMYPFHYYFQVIAPALDGYRYNLFSISHGVQFYPVRIEFEDADIEVQNEEEFMTALANIFSSDKTKGIISALIAQSKA